MKKLAWAAAACAGWLAVFTGPATMAGAVAGDGLTVADPIDIANPKGDVRKLQTGSGPGGAIILTMEVEEYSNPLLDPAWTLGFTGAFWYLDTSGDNTPELEVVLFTDGGGLVAEVYDFASGVFVCDAAASSSAAGKSFSATISQPGCIGDVQVPAVGGIFLYNLSVLTAPVADFVPDNGALARFLRPPPPQPAGGYAVVSRTAGFQRFGALPTGATPSGTFEDYVGPGPVVGTASARTFDGALWSVTGNGEVSTQDDAPFYGDVSEIPLAQPIVGMATVPDGSGYWLVARDGGIFSFGSAEFYGSTGAVRLNQPIVGMAATPSGLGYWLVASDGGIFAYGDAAFYGSTGAIRLNQPVVGMASGLQGQGYWLVARDGGIFSFGMPFYGSTGAVVLQQPIVGMAVSRSGGGYRFIARDGGVFNFGDAQFTGSAALPGRTDVVGLATA